MSTAKFDTLSNLDGTRTIPVSTVAQGTARAWVNFNGTGTVAIRAAFNVSSITDINTGRYVVNFTTALPDANYVMVATAQYSNSAVGFQAGGDERIGTNTASLAYVVTLDTTGANYYDSNQVAVSIFR